MPGAVIPVIESPQLDTGIVPRINRVLKFLDCHKKKGQAIAWPVNCDLESLSSIVLRRK